MDRLEELVEEAEDILARRDAGDETTEEESHCRTSLQNRVSRQAQHLVELRKRLQQIEPRIREVMEKRKLIESDRKCALRNLASAHLRRVGAPDEAAKAVTTPFAVGHQSMTMEIISVGAPADAFNDFYTELRGQFPSLPDWLCTPEDAKRPERDLLGMCPGGKPHQPDATVCYCDVCVCTGKLERLEDISALRKEAAAARDDLQQGEPRVRYARRLLRRLRRGAREDVSDPVFCDDGFEPANDEIMEVHMQAQQQWTMLEKTLNQNDFPLRVVFLDKSGSMGCDAITYEALQLGLHNCLNPTSGSTLTFLFAAPGETQVLLRRPGDEPVALDITLGCATWFNEPILRTLKFLAPIVETLDTKQFIKNTGQPPLQVLCLTDGEDNQSPDYLRSLSGLVGEVKEIVGPTSQRKLYMPIAEPLRKTATALVEDNNYKVPVWMAWIATGMGGQALLNSSTPKELCVIDAVAIPKFREPPALKDIQEAQAACAPSSVMDDAAMDEAKSEYAAWRSSTQKATVVSRARKRMSAALATDAMCAAAEGLDNITMWSIGHRVRIKPSEAGRAAKVGTVLQVIESEGQWPQYEVLMDADEAKVFVDATSIMGVPMEPKTVLHIRRSAAAASSTSRAPQAHGVGRGSQGSKSQGSGLAARTADPDMQRLQVLSVVDAVTRDLDAVMRSRDSSKKGKQLSLEDLVRAVHGTEEVDAAAAEAIQAKVNEASRASAIVSEVVAAPCDPKDVLLDCMQQAGGSAAKLLPEDRVIAQRLLCAGIEILMYGGALSLEHLVDQLGPYAEVMQANSVRRMRVDVDDLETWYCGLARPLQELLGSLLKKGLVECTSSPEGERVMATQDARPCFVALRRFFEPSMTTSGVEDALRRSVNRSQRLKPQFSFCSRSPHRASADMSAIESMPHTPLRDSSKQTDSTSSGSRPSSAGGSSSPGSARASSSTGEYSCGRDSFHNRNAASTSVNLRSDERAGMRPRSSSRAVSSPGQTKRSSSLSAVGAAVLAVSGSPMKTSSRSSAVFSPAATQHSRRSSC